MPVDVGKILKEVGKVALEVVVDINAFYQKVNEIEAAWMEVAAKIASIGKPHKVDPSNKGRVIKLYDAQDVLEGFRVQNLYNHVKVIVKTVQQDIDLLLFLIHPEKTKIILPPQIAGSRVAQFLDHATKLVQSIFQAMDTMLNLIKQVGSLVDLIDLISVAQKQMEERALGQKNSPRYVSVRLQFQSRRPDVGQKTLEAAQKGTAKGLQAAKRALSELADENITLRRELDALKS